MKAAEALKIAQHGKEIDIQSLNDAYELIGLKAGMGATNTSISYNTQTRTIIQRLKDDGYKVVIASDRNEQIIMISWSAQDSASIQG